MNTINIRNETIVHADEYAEPTDDQLDRATDDSARLRRRRQLRLLLLIGLGVMVVSAAGAGVVLRHQSGTGTERTTGTPGAHDGSLAASCLGYVDGPHGVTPLVPAQAGRVVEVLVGEGKPVEVRRAHLVAESTTALAIAQAGVPISPLVQTMCAAQIAESTAFGAPVQENMVVKAGTVLLRLDSHQAQETVLQAECDLNSAIKVHEHKEKLNKSNYVSDTEVYASGELVKQKESQLRLARRALDECELKAPADGTVLRVLTSVGELCGPQSRQPVILFCASGPRIIRAEVEQEFASRVKVGQSARIEDHAGGDGQWRGRVSRVADWYSQKRSATPEAMILNDARTLEFVVEVEPDSRHPLRIGQRVRVKLEQ